MYPNSIFATERGLMMRLIIMIMLLAMSFSGCKGRNEALKQYDLNAVLKISVMKSGDIFADGIKVSMADLEPLLAANAQKRGVVWYYRETGQEEPPPQATQVIQLVIKHKRPVRMSAKPDFSDAIDGKGNSTPR
jgi:hypothetical protein